MEQQPTIRLRVPDDRTGEPGVFVGGQWVAFVDGVAEVPADWNVGLALPGFARIADEPQG